METPPPVVLRLHAESQSGSMKLNVDIDLACVDLNDALNKIRQAVGDAAPIFVDPDFREPDALRRERHAV